MTTPPDFLPEWTYIEWKGRYRPAFRLLSNGKLKYVCRDGSPVECDTAHQAIEAAKECVRKILNPEIRAEKAEVVSDVLGVERWRRERAELTAGDQEAVLGAVIVRGRTVKIERRRARA